MTSEETPPQRCPKCSSLNTLEALTFDGVEQLHTCQTCGHQWMPPAPPQGAWRVGREQLRTLYFNDELVGLVDTPELALVLTTAANLAHATLSDELVAELRSAANDARQVLAATKSDFTARVVAQFVVDHLKRVEEIIGGDDDDDTA